LKKIFKKSWVITIVSVMAILITGTGVFAATGGFAPATLTSTVGTINVVSPPPTANFDYSLSSTQLNFGTITVDTGAQILVASAYIDITNTGNQPIHSLTINMSTPPTGIVSPVVQLDSTLNSDGSGGHFRVTLSGTAPSSETTIDLSTMVCDLTIQ
jgi:hypothetical protein